MFDGMMDLWIKSFEEEFGGRCRLRMDGESLHDAGSDHTEDLHFPPQVIAEPENTECVSQILRWANEHGIPVTPAGALTGLSGGALPINGGIALSTRKMNQIVAVDETNHQVRVQPGVIVQELQEHVESKGLFYAVDPASRGTCTIGGNIAENSGGPRAVKYGVTKDWVLNLEVVLADGTVLNTGANTLKNSTGYNLTSLIVGSEGTLAFVTEATLKLLPRPSCNALMLVPFESAEKACHAVSEIFKSGSQPSALEFMERSAIELAQAFTGDYSLELLPETSAHLLIEVDAFRFDDLMPQVERILPVVEAFGGAEPLFADDEAAKNKLWRLRRSVGEAVKAKSTYKEEDTVVPRGALPDLLKAVKAVGSDFGFESICYGHAGDGNLHVNILKQDISDERWDQELPMAIRSIFQKVVDLGGTISGEHGIGLVQKPFMDLAFSERTLQLQRDIKKVFDPNGIFNPGKIFPEA